MCKSLLIIILFSLSTSLFSQPLNLNDSAAIWSVWNTKIFIQGDTIVDSINYKKVYIYSDSSSTKLVLDRIIRQDSASNRVYGRFPYSWATTEHILYDFSLEKGDTITVANSVTGKEFVFVDDIDSILIGGTYRKRWKIDSPNSYWAYEEYWIDGIGSTYGLTFPGLIATQISHFVMPVLLCYEEDNQTLFMDSLYMDCYLEWPAGSINETDISNQIMVFPNPAGNSIRIESSVVFDQYELISLNGSVIQILTDIPENGRIPLDNKRTDIVILKLYNKDFIAVKRVMKAH